MATVDKIITEAVAEAVAQKILERLQPELRAQYSAAVSEWAENRKVNERLATRLTLLEEAVKKQEQQLNNSVTDREALRNAAQTALQLLNEARKDLGLT